jgi:Holliday junction resolvase RusA-like endonuclease
MDPIRFEIPGEPVPQPRARFTARSGIPRAYTKRGHPITPYRAAIEQLVRAIGPGAISGPIVFFVEAIFARPKSHWTKSGLASGAPEFPGKGCGDWDNLGKGVADAIWHDDTQVVDGRVVKRYASRLEQARTVVVIRSA